MGEQMTAQKMNRLRHLHAESAPEFQPECADPRCEQLWPCDMSKVIATYDALRESHAELLAALREIGSVCNCGLYDTKANRTHMKWCSVVVAKAAIAKAEASNGDS